MNVGQLVPQEISSVWNCQISLNCEHLDWNGNNANKCELYFDKVLVHQVFDIYLN